MIVAEKQDYDASALPDACPDVFFFAAQIQRLQELTRKFQMAESSPEDVLTAEENRELHSLIKAELQASAHRTVAMFAMSTL